jgi:hypothetical protein
LTAHHGRNGSIQDSLLAAIFLMFELGCLFAQEFALFHGCCRPLFAINPKANAGFLFSQAICTFVAGFLSQLASCLY